MKSFITAAAGLLLILSSSWDSIYSQDLNKIHLHITGDLRWGSFKDFNETNGLDIGDIAGEEVAPEPFSLGYSGKVGFSYAVKGNQNFMVDGGYELYRAKKKIHLMTELGESQGIKDYPIYDVRNIPVTFSYLFHENRTSLDLFFGPGFGYQWTRYVERRPYFGNDSFPGSELTYAGSAPIFKITGGVVFDLFRHVSLTVPLGYRHSKIKELKLDSFTGNQPGSNLLVDSNDNTIPLDLSGFTIGIGLNIR